ncbi:hypothetical protein PMIN07_005276 [Paraphaeosphaeria minitans]
MLPPDSYHVSLFTCWTTVGTTYLNELSSHPESVLHQLHRPMTAILASPLLQRSALPDLENLFGDATFEAQPTTQSKTASSQWSVPTAANDMSMTYVHQPSAADPQPSGTTPDDENPSTLYQGLPINAKIGIIVGIVVIVSLSLLSCGMCFLNCKRRQRKRKARRESREAETVMLEMEMRNGQAGPQRCVRKGLWDHLKPAGGDEAVDATQMAEAEARHDAMERNPRDGRHDSIVESARSDSVASRSRVTPRDRVSIVSSVPSIISSTGTRPALPSSFIDRGARR